MRESRLEALIGNVYEAALRPHLWRSVLKDIAEATGSGSAALFGCPVATNIGFHNSPGADGFFDWLAREGHQLHNPRPERAVRAAGLRRAISEQHLFTEWELANIPFNVEMARLGLSREAGGMFTSIEGAPLFFTCQRPAGSDRFSAADLDVMEALFPHLERAAQIAARLAGAHAEGMLESFDKMSCGGVLLDAMGNVIRLNRSAEDLLGACCDVTAKRLTASHPAADAELKRLIRTVLFDPPVLTRTRKPAFAPLPRPSGHPLVVYALPLVGETPDLFQRARAILVIVDPEVRRDVQSELLAQAYGLTPAEIRLATALAAGDELRDIADRHSISLHTARSQLKALMSKTATRRQSELVALLIKINFAPAARDPK
jgi:DNA-binding CsgD family transcriptional regulator